MLLTKEDLEEQTRDVPCQNKEDIEYMVEQVKRFATETRSHIVDWSCDLGQGSRAGTKVTTHIGPGRLSKPIAANFRILTISPKYA